MAMRMPRTTKPIYVSIGHRVSLQTAVNLVRCCAMKGQRVPIPVQEADRIGRKLVDEARTRVQTKFPEKVGEYRQTGA